MTEFQTPPEQQTQSGIGMNSGLEPILARIRDVLKPMPFRETRIEGDALLSTAFVVPHLGRPPLSWVYRLTQVFIVAATTQRNWSRERRIRLLVEQCRAWCRANRAELGAGVIVHVVIAHHSEFSAYDLIGSTSGAGLGSVRCGSVTMIDTASGNSSQERSWALYQSDSSVRVLDSLEAPSMRDPGRAGGSAIRPEHQPGAALAAMIAIGLVTAWFPVGGPLLAGIAGGWLAGGKSGVFAATFVLGMYLLGIPLAFAVMVVGALAGAGLGGAIGGLGIIFGIVVVGLLYGIPLTIGVAIGGNLRQGRNAKNSKAALGIEIRPQAR